MAENKKSFILYCDLIHMVSKLPNDKAGELFKHILKYVNDEDPQTDDLLLQISFEPIKQQLKRDLKVWVDFREKQKLNGAKGGRKKAVVEELPKEILNINPEVTQGEKINPNNPSLILNNPNNPDVILESLNVTVNVTDNVNVNENTSPPMGVVKVEKDEGEIIRNNNLKKATNFKELPDEIKKLCESLIKNESRFAMVTDEILELGIITFNNEAKYLKKRGRAKEIKDVFYYSTQATKFYSLLDFLYTLIADEIFMDQAKKITNLQTYESIIDWVTHYANHFYLSNFSLTLPEMKKHLKNAWDSIPGDKFREKQARKTKYILPQK